jgi:hypothetical protein
MDLDMVLVELDRRVWLGQLLLISFFFQKETLT